MLSKIFTRMRNLVVVGVAAGLLSAGPAMACSGDDLPPVPPINIPTLPPIINPPASPILPPLHPKLHPIGRSPMPAPVTR